MKRLRQVFVYTHIHKEIKKSQLQTECKLEGHNVLASPTFFFLKNTARYLLHKTFVVSVRKIKKMFIYNFGLKIPTSLHSAQTRTFFFF